MPKTTYIRTHADLLAHIESIKGADETKQQFGERIGVHPNTVTRLFSSVSWFQTAEALEKLGLRVMYEVVK